MSIPKSCPNCGSKKIDKKPEKKWTIGSKVYVCVWECLECNQHEKAFSENLERPRMGKEIKKAKKKE